MSASEDGERVLAMVVMLAGASIFAVIISNVSAIVAAMQACPSHMRGERETETETETETERERETETETDRDRARDRDRDNRQAMCKGGGGRMLIHRRKIHTH